MNAANPTAGAPAVRAEPASKRLRYALVTAARNEAELIEGTLRSVIAQTHPPARWIVVSDGSIDGTDQIVQRYAERHSWIELLRLEGGDGRDFARKARAFNAGYEKLRQAPYDVVGNVDADLSFDEDLLGYLLRQFAEMPELGVAGALVLEGTTHYDYRFTNVEDVRGICQLFRRECLEEIDGYLAIERGGIDCVAVTTARMRGWKTRTFVQKHAVHHRQRASAGDWFRLGRKDYALGGHPLWQLARCAYQSTSRPYGISGLMLLSGYALSAVRRTARPVSDEFVRFRRAEQLRRLERAARRLLPFTPADDGDQDADATLEQALARVERWVEVHDYKGYEPFDGLSSYLRPLTFGNQLLEQLLLQSGRQSPINLRPLLGIRPLESTKGRGYMAAGYLAMLELTSEARYRRNAIACLDWLIGNSSTRPPEYCWGNHFDYASRAGRFRKHEPTIVWTSLIGQAFLDAYEHLGDERYLDVARGVCAWIAKLPRDAAAPGTCLSYLADRQTSIHNSNLLGAAMLARTAAHTGSVEHRELARSAMEYSCARQLPSGAWYYGEDPTYHWVDLVHTGYNLDSVKCYIDHTGDERFAPQLRRGFQYFKTHFFDPVGRPRYYDTRLYPIDIQCAAQGIETLAKFADHDPDALPMARQVAQWTVRHMQAASGYFHYRRYPVLAARIPMLHWGQATMYRALALLLTQRRQRDARED